MPDAGSQEAPRKYNFVDTLTNRGMMMRSIANDCWKHGVCLFGLAIAVASAAPANAQLSSGLVSQSDAASAGLKRAWFARAAVNPARSQIVDWILSGDQILILTDAGILQAIDANTGQSLWVTQFGNPQYPSLGPDANDQYVAVLNGSTLYLMDRNSGRIQTTHPIGGAPGAAPAVGKNLAFVPTMTGLVEGYPLDPDEPGYNRWFYQSYGNTMVPPLVTPNSVVWSTDRGYLYVGGLGRLGVRYRLETDGVFDARAAYQDPLIYAVTRDGELFAIDEADGVLRWRYRTGFATDRAPAAVGERLFITSDEPTLHCVDAKSGMPQWEVPGIAQFAAVTEAHVYGLDRFGTIHILNIADGSPVGRISNGGALEALVNDQTDRLYLISDSGLVQCLHEIGANEPTHYGAPTTEKKESAAEQEETADDEYLDEGEPEATPTGSEPDNFSTPAVEENPFAPEAQESQPAEESDFGTGDENPFDF